MIRFKCCIGGLYLKDFCIESFLECDIFSFFLLMYLFPLLGFLEVVYAYMSLEFYKQFN